MARIIFADDQAGLYDGMTERLTEQGHQVLVFKQASEALGYIKDHFTEIDLLITDWVFAGQGFTGADILHLFRGVSDAPALIFSNDSRALDAAAEYEVVCTGKDEKRLFVALAEALTPPSA
ncbi:MAG: hypothetical protein RDU25_03860 [Patescibacteria group bacterium]|nr:hypothetical protein [Patescibacteria group bacterium]